MKTEPQPLVNQPLDPFMKGDQAAEPLYELTSAMTKEALADFCQMHMRRVSRKNMLIIRISGVVLMALGAVNLLTDGDFGFMLFELLCGAFFIILSFLLGRLTASAFMRQWDGPTQARYRLFEEGFEVLQDRSLERRPYSDITDLVANKGALYLYIGKMRGYVLSRDALSGRLDELTAFLERAIGKQAVRAGG